MTSPTVPVRKIRAELRPLRGDRTLISTPRGRHYTVDLAGTEVLRLLDAIAAPERPSRLLPTGWESAAADLERVLSADGAFDEQPDVIAPAAGEPVAGVDGVLVGGDADVAAQLIAAAGRLGATGWAAADPDPRTAVHRAFATGATLLHAVRGGDDASLIALDRLCSDARVGWVPLTLRCSRIWLGPFVTPGHGAGYEDLVARRLAAADDPESHQALGHPSLTGDSGADPDRLAGLFDEVVRRLADTDFRAGDLAIEIDAGDARRHPVLPLPGGTARSRTHRPDDLIDPATGLVLRTRRIAHHASVPPALHTVQADVCTLRRVSRWANNTSCQGSSFGDPDAARAAAIGEAAERYCGNILDTLPIEYGSWTALSRRPIGRLLDPRALVLYSADQYAAPGFPFVELTPDLDVHWVPGRSLTTGEDVWVPASMVYVNWFTAGHAGAAVTNFCPFAGIAAGPTLDYAVCSALEEVIERHATMVWWLNAQPLPALRPTAELQAPWRDVDPASGQRPSVIPLENEFGVPVAAGVLANDAERLLTIGFSARPDIVAASLKAWTEALTLQEGARDLLPADGRHWAAMRRGELNGRSFKPWRADRRYLDDFRADMHDCDDLMVQQQVYLDPRAAERVRHLVERPQTREPAEVPTVGERTVDAYRQRVEALGLEVIVVDITSPDVASTGLRVVRVIVPGTVGNAPAAFPFLGLGRVQELAVELGWRSTPLPEADLNYFPLPHA